MRPSSLILDAGERYPPSFAVFTMVMVCGVMVARYP